MKDIRILFADDESEIRELLVKYLSREGYRLDTVPDGERAVELFKKREYNLVILDIMLPGIDGIEVCKLIRDRANIPIIMLTAKDSEVDRVLGLRIGVMIILQSLFQWRNLLPDLARYLVYKDGEEIKLTSTEFKILKLLIADPGKVYTKKQILNKVWGDDYLEAAK